MRISQLLKDKSVPTQGAAPVWFMRQAGRYLPEYREVRSQTSDFISFCLDPERASKVTLQPIERFDLDAAIIFSDILMIPWQMKRGVHFVQGEGPKLTPLSAMSDLEKDWSDSFEADLAPVADAMQLTRSALAADKDLIGFSGAPWTLMTYMIEGGSSRDFANSRNWLWGRWAESEELLDILSYAVAKFLKLKADSGASVLMIFDSWASAVPSSKRQQVVIEPFQKIISYLREWGIKQPVMCFPKGLGEGLISFTDQVQCDGLGIDQFTDLSWAAQNLRADLVLQGNIDPLCVVAGGDEMYRQADHIREVMKGRPHIFNLGHGFVPHTPPQHVADLVSYWRAL